MSDVASQDFLVFEIAGREFAMNLNLVEEVLPSSVITPIPNSPPFLMGLAGVRGKVMAVINGASRYGIAPALCSYFVICKVRENPTAIAVDRAVLAGTLKVRKLSPEEHSGFLGKVGVDKKFLRDAFEIIEETQEKTLVPTGRKFFEVDPDLFVSAEMASRVGEA